MLWAVLFLLLTVWVIKFGFVIGGIWIPGVMVAGWIFWLSRLFADNADSKLIDSWM